MHFCILWMFILHSILLVVPNCCCSQQSPSAEIWHQVLTRWITISEHFLSGPFAVNGWHTLLYVLNFLDYFSEAFYLRLAVVIMHRLNWTSDALYHFFIPDVEDSSSSNKKIMPSPLLFPSILHWLSHWPYMYLAKAQLSSWFHVIPGPEDETSPQLLYLLPILWLGMPGTPAQSPLCHAGGPELQHLPLSKLEWHGNSKTWDERCDVKFHAQCWLRDASSKSSSKISFPPPPIPICAGASWQGTPWGLGQTWISSQT